MWPVLDLLGRLATSDPEMAKRATRVLAGHEKRLAGFIRQGQEDGSISSKINPAVTARLLLCVVQGMHVLGKTGRSRAEMDSLIDPAMKLLE